MATSHLDAIALLKADHRAVEALFEDFERARGASRKAALVHQICVDLTVHTMIEEEIFYPACRGKIEDSTLDEAYVEHDGAKVLIAELADAAPDEAFYDAKVKVLSEEIKHHVHEEEMRSEGMFAQARDAGLDMDDLGERMQARKQHLKTQFETTGLPIQQTHSMKGVTVEHIGLRH
jgi:galactokinase